MMKLKFHAGYIIHIYIRDKTIIYLMSAYLTNSKLATVTRKEGYGSWGV